MTQKEALELSKETQTILEGLGGTNDGLIGALAAAGFFTYLEEYR